MFEENKFEIPNIFFHDTYSVLDNSIEFTQNEQNSLSIKDKFQEEQINKVFHIYNIKKISTKNQSQEIKQRESICEKEKFDRRKSNIISNKIFLNITQPIKENNNYRKDAYYKHFKAILGKYIKNKTNELKNKCFPYYSKNNFSTPNYKYIGNPKEKDNFNFLSFAIKDLLIYGKDRVNQNRQYNNELLVKFIEINENRAINKNAYVELICFLNSILENVIIQFYDDEAEYYKLLKDSKCIKFDAFFKRETGISLLEKYGFIKALKKYNTKNGT
jgi:hypothetical protein